MDFQFVWGNPRKGKKEGVAKGGKRSDNEKDQEKRSRGVKKKKHPKHKKKLSKTALHALRLRNLAKARKARFGSNPKRKRKARNPHYAFVKTSAKGKKTRRIGPHFLSSSDLLTISKQLGALRTKIAQMKATGQGAAARKLEKQVNKLTGKYKRTKKSHRRAHTQAAALGKKGYETKLIGDEERKKMARRKRKKAKKGTHKRRKTGGRKHSRKKGTHRRKKRKTAMASRKIKYPKKLGRKKRYSGKWKRGRRRYAYSVTRRNPILGAGGKLEKFTGHNGIEVASLLAGGAIYGAVNAFVLKTPALANIVGKVNQTLNMIPGVGSAVTQVVGPALPNLVLGIALTAGGKKYNQKIAQEVGKGIIGASLAAMGANLVDAFSGISRATAGVPTLRGVPTMRGVDYTPNMQGVDYTPGMHGVDYTPGMGAYRQSKADFGKSADFGSASADFGGVPTLRGPHDHDQDADYDESEDDGDENETSSHLG